MHCCYITAKLVPTELMLARLFVSEAKSKSKGYSEGPEAELSNVRLTWKLNFSRLPNNTRHLQENAPGYALGAIYAIRNALLAEFICGLPRQCHYIKCGSVVAQEQIRTITTKALQK